MPWHRRYDKMVIQYKKKDGKSPISNTNYTSPSTEVHTCVLIYLVLVEATRLAQQQTTTPASLLHSSKGMSTRAHPGGQHAEVVNRGNMCRF